MTVRPSVLLLLSVVVPVAACASSEPAAYRLATASHEGSTQVPVFQRTLPADPYQEVAELYAQPRVLNTAADRMEVISAMRSEATSAGCHALILTSQPGVPDTTQPPSYPPSREMQRGVCIIFRDGPGVADKYRTASLSSETSLARSSCSMDLNCLRATDRRFTSIRPVRVGAQ